VFYMKQKKGKQISIRIPHELHMYLEFDAEERGISLNEFINQKLTGKTARDKQYESFNFKQQLLEMRDMVEYRSELTNEMFRHVVKRLDEMSEKNQMLTDKLEGALMDNYRLSTIIFNEIDSRKNK